MNKILVYCNYSIALLNCLTLRKVFTVCAVQFAFFVSFFLRKSIVWGKPYVYTIEPTTRCNFSCPQCDKGRGLLSREETDMSYEDFCLIIDKIQPYAVLLMLFFQGEPLLHPRLSDMIAYARKKRILVKISTNGSLLTKDCAERLVEAGLNELIVSVDAMREETYNKYRIGGDLLQVLSGISVLRTARKEASKKYPIISAQYVVFAHNEQELRSKQLLKKQTKADRVVRKSAQILYTAEQPEWLPLQSSCNRYKNRRRYIDRSGACKRLWSTLVIGCTGKVALCCYDKQLAYGKGNLLTARLLEIYHAPGLQKYREATLRKKDYPGICGNCNG